MGVKGGYVRFRGVWSKGGPNITPLNKTPSNKRDNKVIMYSSTL